MPSGDTVGQLRSPATWERLSSSEAAAPPGCQKYRRFLPPEVLPSKMSMPSGCQLGAATTLPPPPNWEPPPGSFTLEGVPMGLPLATLTTYMEMLPP